MVFPAQPLPMANIGTVYGRWKQWRFLAATGPGSRFLPSGGAGAQVGGWSCIILQKDNLILNGAIVGLQEEAFCARTRRPGRKGLPA